MVFVNQLSSYVAHFYISEIDVDVNIFIHVFHIGDLIKFLVTKSAIEECESRM